jgi:hypothetical protein
MTDPAAPTVTYWAVSILNSRTFWVNAATGTVALLSATDVVTVIPARWLPLAGALVAALNIVLRLGTVRPVALIAPGETKPIQVAKIAPPDPPVVTD